MPVEPAVDVVRRAGDGFVDLRGAVGRLLNVKGVLHALTRRVKDATHLPDLCFRRSEGIEPSVSWGVFGCRSEEHTSELQSLMRISYAVFCLKKQIQPNINT